MLDYFAAMMILSLDRLRLNFKALKVHIVWYNLRSFSLALFDATLLCK
jgi:hypothetical protein